ncbi:jg23170 [Pararge aegeria aegeria]|uniref:Jg23170 protein n=1 Tax=Pararge aegeria aegeria TaxID=348720 RepID=A0A8S4QX36_9NEOP|nr:jg23170 [Pararge aegeria aegeria]
MKKIVTKYVKACIHCAYGKEVSGKKEGYLHPIPKIDIPFHTVHVDHLGPFVKSKKGNLYLLVIVDGFTKFCMLKPLRNLKSNQTIAALTDVFSAFGFPARLISDRGSTFTSKEFELFCNSSYIRHILNAVASPRSNGQVERYNRTVLDALGSYADKLGETKWDQTLGKIQWGLNNTLNKGIGKTPSEALFGRLLTHSSENMFSEMFTDTRNSTQDIDKIRSEISSHINKDQEQQKKRFDVGRKEPKIYSVGDLVKIKKQINCNEGKSRKLLPVYSGPYKITKVLNNDRYEISSIPGLNLGKKEYSNIWAVDQIQPWINTLIDCDNDSTDSEET